MCHTYGVHAWAEHGDGGVVGHAEGFDAFEGLLAVVEGGGHAVDLEVGGFDEGWGGPLLGFSAVVAFYMAVHLGVMLDWGELGEGIGGGGGPSRTRKPMSSQSAGESVVSHVGTAGKVLDGIYLSCLRAVEETACWGNLSR